jgi:hypothetical protein
LDEATLTKKASHREAFFIEIAQLSEAERFEVLPERLTHLGVL